MNLYKIIFIINIWIVMLIKVIKKIQVLTKKVCCPNMKREAKKWAKITFNKKVFVLKLVVIIVSKVFKKFRC